MIRNGPLPGHLRAHFSRGFHSTPLLPRSYGDHTTKSSFFQRSPSLSDDALKDHFFKPKTTTSRNGLRLPVVAIAGATGAVGIEMRKCLEQLKFPFHSLRVFAHPSEEGDLVQCNGIDYPCESVDENSFDNVDIALFSAGDVFSKEWVPTCPFTP